MLGETARLATELTLKDGLTPGLGKSQRAVGRFDGALGKAGKGVRSFGGTLAKTGAVAGGAFVGGLVLAVKTGLGDLATLETAVTSVDGAIKQVGLTGKVTGQQVADWANDIERDIGAAFDDKDITAAAATLIRFGKVTKSNLKPALVVMTDLATKTGSVESASALLAKALADPAKAAARLTRAGIILTKQQQDQIKAFVKAGKTAEAQKVILDALAKTTGGAAAASQGKYARAIAVLGDVAEDARKALAEGFLPVIERVADKLSTILADPKAIKSIRDFGNGLAGAFDKAIDFAEKVPWETIGNGLKTSAEWAGKLFDVFRSLPPEVQTTIVALAGLNKVSGGAVTGIVGELGKGLIKGVLGLNAGVVNINAGVVNGAGGVPGATGATGAGASVGGVVKGAAAITGGVAAAEGAKQIGDALASALAGGNLAQEQTAKQSFDLLRGLAFGPFETLRTLPDKISAIPQEISQVGDFLGGRIDIMGNPIVNSVDALKADTISEGIATRKAVTAAGGVIAGDTRSEGAATRTALSGVKVEQQKSLIAFRAGERATLGVTSAVNSKMGAANAKLDALRHKKTSFSTHVNVYTSVSVRDFQKNAKISSRVARTTVRTAS